MPGKGNCYDNTAVETFFKTIKAVRDSISEDAAPRLRSEMCPYFSIAALSMNVQRVPTLSLTR